MSTADILVLIAFFGCIASYVVGLLLGWRTGRRKGFDQGYQAAHDDWAKAYNAGMQEQSVEVEG